MNYPLTDNFYRADRFTYWTCVCGSTIEGHSCGDDIDVNKKLESLKTAEAVEHLQHGGAEMFEAIDQAWE